MYKPQFHRSKRRLRFLHIYFLALSLMLALALTGLLAQTALARTYVITDGDMVLTYTTFATSPDWVLDKAGVTLSRFDTYTTEAVEGAQAITVCRAQDVTVHYHGKVMKTTSQGETAGELLERLGLEVCGEDILSHGLDTKVWNGMELKVDRVITAEEIYTCNIPHETEYRSDPDIPMGENVMLSSGEDGELLCTARVTYVNGEESDRLVLTQRVTRDPVTETRVLGTGNPGGVDTPIIGDGYILLPTGELLTFTRTDTVRATAYTHTDEGCDYITATGTQVRRGTVAVDPRYIPYGTRMFIMASDGSYIYGLATAEDCGGDIKGDRMDLYFPTFEECIEFGRRRCTLYFLG